MTKVFTQNNNYEPATWKGLQLESGGRSAYLVCPQCDQLGVLIDHEILPDGTVQPSVVCPTQGCTFHEMIKLEGWND